MLQAYPGVRSLEETDDVFQNAVIRLYRALKQVVPASVREFIGLATTQIRRELIDLARYYQSRQNTQVHIDAPRKPNASSNGPTLTWDRVDTTPGPEQLASWTNFHEQIGALPEDDREMFDLLWYQGLTQSEAAGLLQMSLATVKRRWLAARRKLCRALDGDLPS
jgi:RNA polymerase sigma-70 factor (ECF subfamily)